MYKLTALFQRPGKSGTGTFWGSHERGNDVGRLARSGSRRDNFVVQTSGQRSASTIEERFQNDIRYVWGKNNEKL